MITYKYKAKHIDSYRTLVLQFNKPQSIGKIVDYYLDEYEIIKKLK